MLAQFGDPTERTEGFHCHTVLVLKCGRRSILFATATASMRAQPAPYFSTLDLNSSVRDSGALDEVWAHTLASQGGLRSLLRTTGPALLEVASVEDSIQNQYGRPACDPPR